MSNIDNQRSFVMKDWPNPTTSGYHGFGDLPFLKKPMPYFGKWEPVNAILNTKSKIYLALFSVSNRPTWVTLLP